MIALNVKFCKMGFTFERVCESELKKYNQTLKLNHCHKYAIKKKVIKNFDVHNRNLRRVECLTKKEI